MTRPLPEVTAQNEFFWTAGADGVLRIQECKDCDALIHPPQPICRYCRSHNMGVRDVSGQATLSAFTVNHRFGFPDLPPPYVVAQVAIVEDPRVRLTTNIIDCEPDDLELGQTVEVLFDKAEDRRLAAAVQAGRREDDRAAARRRDRTRRTSPSTCRRCSPRRSSRTHSAITGIGMSRIGRRLMVPPLSLTIEACEAGGRRRRSDVRRHRRPVDLSGPRHRRHGRGRRDRARGRARHPADVDQRRHGHLRPRRLGDRGDDGRGHRHGPPRAVLPHAVGGDLPAADEGRQDVAARGRPHLQLADAVRRDVGGAHTWR